MSDRDEREGRHSCAFTASRDSPRTDFSRMLVVLAFVMLVTPAMTFLATGALKGSADGAPGSVWKATTMATGLPPQILIPPLSPTPGEWNSTFSFDAYAFDPNNDSLNVTWDWGDGTPIEVNHTGPALELTELDGTHVYKPYYPGQGGFDATLFMNLSVDDGNGNNVTVMTTVVVQNLPRNAPPASPLAYVPTNIVDPADTVTIHATSSDAEGDALTWTYVFNDSVSDFLTVVNNTPQTAPDQVAWSNVSVIFGAPGNYTVKIYVSDAVIPYQVFPHNVTGGTLGPIRVAYNQKPGVTNVITVDPPSPFINATLGYVDVDYKIDVSDPDGDVVTATWNFDDGTANVTNVTGGGTGTYSLLQVRNYTDPGFFNVSVTVTDGRPGHEITLTTLVMVNSTNRPPSVLTFTPDYVKGDSALPNQTVNFTLVIFEPENDNVMVIIDFGDGSERLYLNLTEFVDNNVSARFSHAFAKAGNYTVVMWYTDNKSGSGNHSKQYTLTVKVKVPPVITRDLWSWWDYTSLGLLCMIPVLVAVQFLFNRSRRKRLEEEGLSLEEWKLIRSQDMLETKRGGP